MGSVGLVFRSEFRRRWASWFALSVLVAVIARRRRQFAVLKVLGMYRRQVASTLCWQSLTVAVVGVVLGVPLGVAVGRFVWHDFAIKLGVVPVNVVNVTSLLVSAVLIVVGGVLLSLVPAILTTQVRPAQALRDPA